MKKRSSTTKNNCSSSLHAEKTLPTTKVTGLRFPKIKPSLAQWLQNEARVHGSIGYSRKGCVGFDCGHSGDFRPLIDKPSLLDTRIYRDIAYVTEELNSLVTQYLALRESNNGKAA